MTLRIALYGVFFLPIHTVILISKSPPAPILTVTAQKKMRGHITEVYVPLIFLVLS